MARLRANQQEIAKGLERALAVTAAERSAQFRRAIEASVYPWPQPTNRRNGQRVSTPRNIVDEGSFRDSQQLLLAGLRAQWLWDAEHSIYVYFGFTSRSGNVFPGRDFIGYADDQDPLDEALGRACRDVFS